MAMNQAGVSVAVGRFGCVLAQGIFTSFSEPQSTHFLKCPNLDLLGGRGHPPGRCSAVKAPREHPRRACCVAWWGRITCFVWVRLHAKFSAPLCSSNLQGLGKVSNTLASCASVKLGICCSIALLCCANTSETCVAPGETILHVC